MKIGIIQFPGTNCERETRMALTRCGMEAVSFLWNEDRRMLEDCDGFVLAGGFSYEDRSRSGIIAALDPVIPVIREAASRGKPVLGICNGAQVVVEAGLVPDLSSHGSTPEIALTTNKRIKDGRIIGTGYYNTWSTLRAEHPVREQNPWYRGTFTSRFSPGECITVPAAHGEGRFLFPPELLEAMESWGLIPFRYADAAGVLRDEFPVNPNGSQAQAAAVTNLEGTVMAMMPHPERTEAGDKIFLSMADFISREKTITVTGGEKPKLPAVVIPDPEPFHREAESEELIIRQIITDNEAVTVESTLEHLGISARIQRHVHWEIEFDPQLSQPKRRELLERMSESGELYNSNKELPVSLQPPEGSRTLLVREREDIAGAKTAQALRSWFGCTGVSTVTRGILWTVIPEGNEPADAVTDAVLRTHILMNPHAYKGYIYA